MIIDGTGAAIYKGSEVAFNQVVKAIKKMNSKEQFPEAANTKMFPVTAEGVNNEGLDLIRGPA